MTRRARILLLSAALGFLVHSGAMAQAGMVRERIAERIADRRAQAGADELEQEATGAASRVPLPAGVGLLKDVAYGNDPRQRFDVYAAKGLAQAPVILLVHGGGWRSGDKAMGRLIDNKVARWASQGFIVVSVNYRLLPQADVAAQAADVGAALALAQQQAAGWGGDRARFILMGHSAGAHLVSLLASAPTPAGVTPWRGAVALDSAAFDVELIMRNRHFPLYDRAFGADPALWKAVSPYAALAGAGQPLLAVCSSRRADSCAQAQRYAARAQAMGRRVHVLPQDLSHGEINATLGLPGAYTDAVDQFLRALL